jgi:hypothetical protein
VAGSANDYIDFVPTGTDHFGMASAAARARLRLITVQTPCHVDWNTMSGGDAVRHCGSCRKNVYNLSAMTEADAETLMSSAGDHCIRFYYRADGTIVSSSSCADIRHKAPSAVAAGLAAILGAAAAFAGIRAVTDHHEQAASARDERVLVAMGMKLTIKPPVRRDKPVSDVTPSLAPKPVRRDKSVSDVTPSLCSDPWGCDESAPEADPQSTETTTSWPTEAAPATSSAGELVAATTSSPVETARASSRTGVLVGLLGGLVALLVLSLAFVRRHVKVTLR